MRDESKEETPNLLKERNFKIFEKDQKFKQNQQKIVVHSLKSPQNQISIPPIPETLEKALTVQDPGKEKEKRKKKKKKRGRKRKKKQIEDTDNELDVTTHAVMDEPLDVLEDEELAKRPQENGDLQMNLKSFIQIEELQKISYQNYMTLGAKQHLFDPAEIYEKLIEYGKQGKEEKAQKMEKKEQPLNQLRAKAIKKQKKGKNEEK